MIVGVLIISECVNHGSVEVGIISSCAAQVVSAEIKNCYNCGSVGSGSGVMRSVSAAVRVNNCYNIGYKIVNDVKSDGGLVGKNSGRYDIKFVLFKPRDRRWNNNKRSTYEIARICRYVKYKCRNRREHRHIYNGYGEYK